MNNYGENAEDLSAFFNQKNSKALEAQNGAVEGR
jgi:hypothetical protein